MIEQYYDKNGVPVMEGDIIKVFHFRAAKRRNVYMYKKIFRIQERLQAVCLLDFGEKPLMEAHRCNLEDCGDYEVIWGVSYPTERGDVDWFERPRQKKRDRMPSLVLPNVRKEMI